MIRQRAATLISRLVVHLRLAFDDPVRRFQLSLLVLVFLGVYATLGYIIIEKMTVTDAIYMTVITVATVGFGEVVPLSPTGRMFTVTVIILGIGVATTAISNGIGIVISPLMWTSIQRRKMENMINALNDHYIVCGYGRMGRQIALDLTARGEKFVVIESREEMAERLTEARILHVIGDATEDESLIHAGVERAKGLVTVLSTDPGNMMTVLSARELNRKLFIAARVVRPESESKLMRAGADRVINPYQIGGHRMALSLLRPAVHDFLEHIFHFGQDYNVDVGQIRVEPGSRYAEQTVGSCDLRSAYGVNILAVRRPEGDVIITPNPAQELSVGDTLIVIGPQDAIIKLEHEHRQ